MEPLNNKASRISKWFIKFGLIMLATGILFGLVGALQYVIPGFLKDQLSFEQVRPLHVSSVVFWIISTAVGAVISYFHAYKSEPLFSPSLLKIQFGLFISAIFLICFSYLFSIFGGREYWEFPPILGLPILLSWLLFVLNFFKKLGSIKNQPVYVWMWMTGIIFFLITFLESYLWLIPGIRNHFIKDLTLQWKSYGSMVGSWNMLIYGCSFFLMEKISGKTKYAHSKLAFTLYFLGLFNLMFNWGHHVYLIPTHEYVKHIGYLISMTELLLLGRIIYLWKSALSDSQKYFHHHAYRFIIGADIWIFLTLLLAILMSIPAINVYTHGTHITVAHTMGATIGINSFLLLAYCYDILFKKKTQLEEKSKNSIIVFWILNISLFVFWVSLIIAGILKASWNMSEEVATFSSMMQKLRPYFILFFSSGLFVFGSLYYFIFQLLINKKCE